MKIEINSFLKGIIGTYFAEGFVLLSSFFVYRLVSQNFGAEGLGEYLLIKRIIVFFQPVFLLGFITGIPYFLAKSKDQKERSTYLKSAFISVAILNLLVIFLISFFSTFFSRIFFGKINYASLVIPFLWLWVGFLLHSFLYAYLRGRILIYFFNFFQIINLGIIPIFVLFFGKNLSLEKAIILIAKNMIIISLFGFLFVIKELLVFVEKKEVLRALKNLLFFSIPRLIGGMIMGFLFASGPIISAHLFGLKEVAYLSLGLNIFSALAELVAPLGIILLPQISFLLAQQKKEIIEKNLNIFLIAFFQIFIFIFFQILIFTDLLLKYWLGEDFLEAVPFLRIFIFSLIFYLFYEANRNIIDATEIKPINAINTFFSLIMFSFLIIIFLSSKIINSSIISFALSYTMSFILLGLLTYFSLKKFYKINIKNKLKNIFFPLFLNIFFLFVGIIIKKFLITIYHLFVFELLILFFYLFILWYLKSEWIEKILKGFLLTK